MANGTQYSIVFKNNSTNDWTACVYQKPPNLGTQDAMSLAWLTKSAAKGTSLTFTWTVDYAFVWAETGKLSANAMFTAAQIMPADPSGSNNAVTLTQNESGAFHFTNQTAGDPLGSLVVNQDRTIPADTVSVGVAMGGFGTYVVSAEPNILAVFTPTPNYWITFGTYTQGEVMDIEQITKPQEIAFPPNVFSMTAILGEDNQWTVIPTSQANRSLVQRRRANPRALFGAV